MTHSHPRKFIPDAIAECLNLDAGEAIIDYKFICLDQRLFPYHDTTPNGTKSTTTAPKRLHRLGMTQLG
jgi:hypothetical protein